MICCKKVVSAHCPAGTKPFSLWSYWNHKHQLVGNSQLCLNVSLIKKKQKTQSVSGFLFTALEQGQAGTPESPSQRSRRHLWPGLRTAGWKHLANKGSHFLRRRSCAQHDQVPPGRPQRRKPLPLRPGLYKAHGGTSELSDQQLRERDPWEGHQDKENAPACSWAPPGPLAGPAWRPRGPEGQAGLVHEVSAWLFKEFSHSVILFQESPLVESPKVTAVKVDLANFIHKFNLLVPSRKTQGLCLTAVEGVWGFEVRHVKDEKLWSSGTTEWFKRRRGCPFSSGNLSWQHPWKPFGPLRVMLGRARVLRVYCWFSSGSLVHLCKCCMCGLMYWLS